MATTLKLNSDEVRKKALEWIRIAPAGSSVTFERPKRSIPQNDLMWSLLDQLARKALYHGLKLDKESWKLIMLSGIRKEIRVVPNLDNSGFLSLDRSTSRLSIAEMNMMIEVIEAWAATNGVTLTRTMNGLEPIHA